MPLIDDKGKIFGIINILDLALLSFFLVLVLSLFLYSKYPLQIKEHKEVTFQIVFTGFPDAIAEGVFVPGTPLIASYAKEDKATITAVQKVILYLYDVGGRYNLTSYIVTINSSLEVDAEGDILFNGNDVAPGNYHDLQIGNSYISGQIWRVDYEHRLEAITVKIQLPDVDSLYSKVSGDVVFDSFGNIIGEVVVINRDYQDWYLTLSLNADVYDDAFFVSEMLIEHFAPLYFWINNTPYKGTIVEVHQ
ncbi:MAG: DUF4330 family protein [Nanoarchaeota archaeon]